MSCHSHFLGQVTVRALQSLAWFPCVKSWSLPRLILDPATIVTVSSPSGTNMPCLTPNDLFVMARDHCCLVALVYRTLHHLHTLPFLNLHMKFKALPRWTWSLSYNHLGCIIPLYYVLFLCILKLNKPSQPVCLIDNHVRN
jgi:hypothetical protein